jgi:hypothetical protein
MSSSSYSRLGANAPGDDDFYVKIKSTTDTKDFDVPIDEAASIEELQRTLFIKLDLGQGKKIRLIASGKLLDPVSKTLKEFKIKKGDYIHAVVSNITTVQHVPTPPPSSGATQIPTNRRGLNRLLNEGISIDEVTAVRLSFRDSIDDMEDSVPMLPEEDPREYRLRLEEAWMANQGSNSEFSANFPNLAHGDQDEMNDAARQWAGVLSRGYSSTEDESEIGSYRDFMWGFIMGSLLGFVMIFCVWDRNVSHRQKIGILFGIIFQMLMGAVQSDSEQVQQAASSSTSPSATSPSLRGSPTAGVSVDNGSVLTVIGTATKGPG